MNRREEKKKKKNDAGTVAKRGKLSINQTDGLDLAESLLFSLLLYQYGMRLVCLSRSVALCRSVSNTSTPAHRPAKYSCWHLTTDDRWIIAEEKDKSDNRLSPFEPPLDYARFHSFQRHTHYFSGLHRHALALESWEKQIPRCFPKRNNDLTDACRQFFRATKECFSRDISVQMIDDLFSCSLPARVRRTLQVQADVIGVSFSSYRPFGWVISCPT